MGLFQCFVRIVCTHVKARSSEHVLVHRLVGRSRTVQVTIFLTGQVVLGFEMLVMILFVFLYGFM